ncbi:MAG TPA: AbrB/MazE/SpoVT family DNA-binding domain-containing protein [Candidatus Methanoperedens sp.]
MVTRKIQYANGSFFSVIPGALVDALGLNPGDKISFGIEKGKILIAAVPNVNPEPAQIDIPDKEVPEQ